MTRKEIIEYAAAQYGSEPEYLWTRYPGYAVFRHRGSGKWYALLADVPAEKLGLSGAGAIDILNVKNEPMTVDFFRRLDGFFPAYHMNKKSWISLDISRVPESQIKELIDASYIITAVKNKRSGEKNV